MSDFSQYDGGKEEWRAVLATAPPLDAPPFTRPVERREFFNKLAEAGSAAAMSELTHKIQIRSFTLSARDGTPLDGRSYRPIILGNEPLPVFYYIHGGGFLTGTLDVDDATCTGFALSANVVVVHINYRHTPEFTYPTAWNDTEDGFTWLHEHMDIVGGIPESVVVGGISAGAQLAASLVLQKWLGNVARDAPPIAGQVLMVPLLAHPETRLLQLASCKTKRITSYESNKHADMLPLAELRILFELLNLTNPDPRDLRVNIVNATPDEVKGLPPTTIAVSGLDVLRDEGLEYGKLLAEAG